MPIGKERNNPSDKRNPQAEAWLNLATSAATDPQDYLNEDPEDIEAMVKPEDLDEAVDIESSDADRS